VSIWREIIRLPRQWSLYSLMSTGVSKKGTLLQNGEKYKLTIHGAPHWQKAYIQLGVAWFPRRIVKDTAITTPLPCSLWHNTVHLGLGRPEPRYPECAVATLNTCYRLPRDPGVEYEST
jgi:hypothetical protein